jgi:wobble nucleotide-excising tRNase
MSHQGAHKKHEKNEHTSMKNDHEVRITRLEVVVENVNTTLVDIKRGIERLEDKMESRFAWILGIGATTLLSLFGTIVLIIMKLH